MKPNVAEVYNEEYAPRELKPGLWVNCRRSHHTKKGTVVYEGLMKDGTVFKGTKAQLVKVCSPTASKSGAAKRQAKPAPLIEVTAGPEPAPVVEEYAAVELAPGQWVAACELIGGGYAALDRKGKRHEGAAPDILSKCDPYSRKQDAAKRAERGEAN